MDTITWILIGAGATSLVFSLILLRIFNPKRTKPAPRRTPAEPDSEATGDS